MRTPTPQVEAWFDGALDSDARAGYGFVIARDDRVVFTASGYVGAGAGVDSMTAEYAGCVAVLRYLAAHGIERAVICGDCRSLVEAQADLAHVSPRHREAACQIAVLSARLPQVNLKWIPRSYNGQADQLASAALKNFVSMEKWGDLGNTRKQPKQRKKQKPAPRIRKRARRTLSRLIDLIS